MFKTGHHVCLNKEDKAQLRASLSSVSEDSPITVPKVQPWLTMANSCTILVSTTSTAIPNLSSGEVTAIEPVTSCSEIPTQMCDQVAFCSKGSVF